MKMKKVIVLLSVIAFMFAVPMTGVAAGPAKAFESSGTGSSIGVYCWQQAPYVDIICVDLEDKGFVFEATGTDHVPDCYKYPVDGSAVFDEYKGEYVLGFVQYYGDWAPTNTAYIDPATLDGVWFDDLGNSGDFLFLGPGPMAEGLVASEINRRDSGPK